MTWRATLGAVLSLALDVGFVLLGAWVGNAIDVFLTAQLGAFESKATGYVVLLTMVAAWWANRVGIRRTP